VSLVDDLIAEQVGVALEELGDAAAVTYTVPGGSPSIVSAILGHVTTDEFTVDDGQGGASLVKRQVRSISVSRDASGLSDVRLDASVTIASVVWEIDRIDRQSSTWTRATLGRVPSMSRTRSDFVR